MTEKQKYNSKITKIKEILPILWHSYEHMCNVRETNTKNSINFLLVIVTFLPILCFTLYNRFGNPLFLVPIFFQVIALLILLKSFFIPGQIPWLTLENTLSQLDSDSFEVELFATLKAAESDTGSRLQTLRTIIQRALFLLIFSIFLIVLACLFIFLEGSILLYVATALLIFVFSLLYFFYNNTPKSNFDNEYKKFKDIIEKWLKNKKTETFDKSN